VSDPSTFNADYTDYFQNLIQAQKTPLGLGGDVAYGDQERIPFVPFVCIEPGTVRITPNGTQRRNMVEILTHVIVYHGEVRSVQTNLREADELAEAIRVLCNSDPTCGGLSIDCYVREVEPGYQKRGNSLFRASMLTIEARQQELLPLIS
jgi:hypothetical protein